MQEGVNFTISTETTMLAIIINNITTAIHEIPLPKNSKYNYQKMNEDLQDTCHTMI